ncbi:hypothetical protein HPB52_011311 [Rhipicephalus sanguineus]|uniref:Endonuclease/exonuclease/phosphatase domain-containing protein n=1 Tax=Rhipicephalus sanguineus TaxID=34632 RepID=A0A9D4T3U1_RHISA|nr:hypothetical protein HPB52_011311 [Rhipicephalus sanguineus]
MKMAGSNKEIPFPHLALELPPRDQLTDFDHFIRELRKRTRGPRLVVVGDFNAPHTAWGYAITTKKGARVHDVAQQHGLTLWNDPLQPTRVANSISRDTKPDLTFTRDFKKAGWTCLPETLGSDHHIIQLDIGYERRPTKTGTARLMDWNAFRNKLDVDKEIADIDTWLTKILDTAQRLTHNYEGSEEDLLRELCNKLRGPVQSATIPPPPKEYEGIPNADPDRPFTPAELQVAISKLTRNTSPGKDRIVNKRLRQLPNHALTALLRYYNECWEKGELPAAWKHSETRASPSTGCKYGRSPRFEYSACTCTATDQGPPRFLDFNTRFSNSRTL